MKRILSVLIALTIIFTMTAALADPDYSIRNRVTTTYDAVTVDKIEVNTSIESGKLIVLAYLKWDRDNSVKTSQKMISMYSEDLAAYVAQMNDNIERICIFWNLPKLFKPVNDPDAKAMYDVRGNDAYLHSLSGPLFYLKA